MQSDLATVRLIHAQCKFGKVRSTLFGGPRHLCLAMAEHDLHIEKRMLRLQVMAGWRFCLSGHGRPQRFQLEDVRIHAYDTSAWVTCTEILEFPNSRGR